MNSIRNQNKTVGSQTGSEISENDEFLYSIWNFFAANLSERTRKNYYNIVKNYIKTVGHTPMKLSEKDAETYFNDLTNRLNSGRLSYSTALMRMSVMRGLCDYIKLKNNREGKSYTNYFKDYILPDTDKTITEEKLPKESELAAVLELAAEYNDDTAYLIFSLVLKCGLTSSEVCSLKTEYLLYDTDECLCIHFPEKKRISRIIKLPSDITQLLLKYISAHRISTGSIFYNKRGTPLKMRDAERLLKKYVNMGISENRVSSGFTLQDMRHAAFKYMLLGGADEAAVAGYAGITTKWMSRYRQIVNERTRQNAADFSTLTIKPSVYDGGGITDK